VVVLGCTVLIGTTLGGRYRVAPPVLLICLGGLLGLVPGLSAVELDPDVVLLLFLPAILYWESLNTSLREIRANLRVIVLSSVVLVIVTMAAVAYAGRALGMDPGRRGCSARCSRRRMRRRWPAWRSVSRGGL